MYDTVIIGGGASGLACAIRLKGNNLIIEQAERVGKKILSTGNGRCNLGNTNMSGEYYSHPEFFERIQSKSESVAEFWKEMGLFVREDSAGRLYPFSNQASTVLDILRLEAEKHATILTSSRVTAVERRNGYYEVKTHDQSFQAKNVVLSCGGGKCEPIKNLVEIGKTYPALCALKTDVTRLKGLDGVRVHAKLSIGKAKTEYGECGEVLFRNYGISGIAVFNASLIYARSLKCGKGEGYAVTLDLLDGLDKEDVKRELEKRIKEGRREDLLRGIISVKVGNAVLKNTNAKSAEDIIYELSNLKLEVRGLMGENAQITVGGVGVDNVNDCLELKTAPNLYVCGEALDMDGLCGGYNLHWAFLSALRVAHCINNK